MSLDTIPMMLRNGAYVMDKQAYEEQFRMKAQSPALDYFKVYDKGCEQIKTTGRERRYSAQ